MSESKGVVITLFVMRRVLPRIMRLPKCALWAVKRQIKPPTLPVNDDGGIYIHLGCGRVNSPEFINVDMLKAPYIHYIQDVKDLSCFSSDYADLIYACHVIEHFSPREIQNVFSEWRRVLKKDAILRISVPDFDKLLSIYERFDRDIETIQGPLIGTKNEYSSHLSVFNEASLRKIFERAGFSGIRTWEPDEVEHHDFEDWASRHRTVRGESFKVSLNIEGVKR